MSLWHDGEIVGKPRRYDGDAADAGAKLRPLAGLAALIDDFLT